MILGRLMVAAGVAVVLVAGCSSTDSPPLSPSSSPSSAEASATSPSASPLVARGVVATDLSEQIEHVHGLVATGEDTVVAGTHDGARTVDAGGKVSSPGEDRDDLMGMTGEAGSQKLASSGHPGPGSSLPNPVGLLTSADGGATWKPVSLQGEVDFHALAVSGDDVIGYGGGSALMVSDDGGKNWKDGAEVQAAALAYSGDRILATTQSGLQVSTDGGQSFEKVSGAPLLALISAGTDETVLGLDPEGMVWSSTDRGATWEKVGEATDAQAVAASSQGRGFAVSQTQLFAIG